MVGKRKQSPDVSQEEMNLLRELKKFRKMTRSPREPFECRCGYQQLTHAIRSLRSDSALGYFVDGEGEPAEAGTERQKDGDGERRPKAVVQQRRANEPPSVMEPAVAEQLLRISGMERDNERTPADQIVGDDDSVYGCGSYESSSSIDSIDSSVDSEGTLTAEEGDSDYEM